MGIDITALTTNADKLGECIDKNKKQEQDRKDEQLYGIIERKVKKEEHKREKPRGQDGTLKKCKRLFEKDASPEVLTKLEESLREQEKYYRYYVQCFLPVLDKAIERSKKISNETKERVKQAISEITYNSKYCNQNDRRDSGIESDYSSDAGDDYEKHSISNPNTANEDQEVEKSNEITNSNALLLKAIKNGNNRKFEKYLKDCTDISSIKNEKGNNILHLIVSLEKKQKRKFLGILIKTVTKKDLAQLINSENQTPLQVALINKITKEKHESHTIQDNDNILKFLTKLLEHGASHDQLELPEESLKKLSKGQNEYYCKFLKKLAKKAELKQEIKIKTEAKVKEIVAHTVNTPNSNSDYPLHLAIKNNDKELFKELLQEGANISLEGANKNNALHHIALLKGEYKIKYLKLILDFEKKGVISSEKLHKAINAQNKDDKYPAQVALIRQTEKIPSKLKDFSRWVRSRPTKHYYTAEFCAELLQNGAENKSDHITIPKEHRKQKYYQTTKRIKDITGVSPDPETQEELEEHFSKKNARKNISLPVKWILGGLIFATVFSALAGNMIAAAALSVTIAVCAMCYPIYLKLENALNARASDQSEHTENPATKMSDVSILRQFMNKLDGLTNKPSSLAL
ncbi:ankyrin repeat domain-containing protein [Wolbachia endosymbiont of Drosophila innubila]|uniref:ankyrin repeat domain-containing protein n=1 Tax=Wolbachia TaxID=953 RepID=UPI001680D045|nr:MULTISPECIES: ankyrin repeat domain-containing protein [Wolbachia]MBA8752845.1 ankyrin repeat domain-containing protein [Wolbachia pipientis]UID81541.1 ankyrin repeat domain-containing protein [Wolbachia endosymbiont of Drosophila innubila]